MANLLGTYFNGLFVQIGTFFGIIQGLAWGILALVAMIWHLSAKHKELITYQDPYPNLLQTYFYYTFIKNNANPTKLYIQPDGFFGVMLVYFFLSIAWMGASIYTYAGYKKHFNIKQMILALIIWSITALTTLIVDLIFCSFLAADYKFVIDEYNAASEIVIKLAYTYSTIGYGIMMILAARGLVLWVLNLILTGIIIKICIELKFHPPSEELEIEEVNIPPARTREYIGNLPDEATNYHINEVPRRRQTEPSGPQFDMLSTSSTFAAVNKNTLYMYDPEVERRLNKYKMTPNRIKNRFI